MPHYPARLDRVYRSALLLFTVCIGLVAMSTVTSSEALVTLGHWGAAISLMVAGWTFLVWLPSWRWVVRGLVLGGLVTLMWPHAPLVSWALTLGASAIMAAKETHCFHFKAGKIIPWYTLGLGLFLLLGMPPVLVGLAWLGLFGLWAWLLTGRLRLPLFVID